MSRLSEMLVGKDVDVPCPKCNGRRGPMVRTRLHRFPARARVIGLISFVVPAVAAVILLAMRYGDYEPLGGSVTIFQVFLFAVFSAMPGAILTMSRRVYRCTSCGHVIDRA